MGLLKSDTVYLTLRGVILAAELEPGAPLRGADLAARHGFGLTPIREALTRLQAEGFVVAAANRGFSVAPVTLAGLRDLTRTQALLEGALLADALANGGTEWEAAVLAAHHRLARTPPPRPDAAPDERHRWLMAHEAFHGALLSAAQGDWLRRLHHTTTEHLRRYQCWLLRAHARSGPGATDAALFDDLLAVDHHTRLTDAVLARDAAAAGRLMAEHTTLSTTAFLRLAGAHPFPETRP